MGATNIFDLYPELNVGKVEEEENINTPSIVLPEEVILDSVPAVNAPTNIHNLFPEMKNTSTDNTVKDDIVETELPPPPTNIQELYKGQMNIESDLVPNWKKQSLIKNTDEEFGGGLNTSMYDSINQQWIKSRGEKVPSALINIKKILKNRYGIDENNRTLTEEIIFKDKDLRKVVIEYMTTRRKPGISLTPLTGGSGKLYSGADFKQMEFSKVFEMYQNNQRAFGTHDVSTMNELVYNLNAKDTDKLSLGAGYVLFNHMDNIFTGERTSSEMFDGLWDYARYSIFSPSTAASFLVGYGSPIAKFIAQAETKAASTVGKKLMTSWHSSLMKNGLTKSAANELIETKILNAATYQAVVLPEMIFNVAINAGYQYGLMETSVKDSFSKIESGLIAAGTLATPYILLKSSAMFAKARQGPLKNTFLGYEKLDKAWIKKGQEGINKQTKNIVGSKAVIEAVMKNFNLKFGKNGNPIPNLKGKEAEDFMLSWKETKEQAALNIKRRKEELTDGEIASMFFKQFWLGSKDKKTKGYFDILTENGWAVHKSQLDGQGGTTNAYSQAIKFLPVEVQRGIVKEFESSTGLKLNLMTAGQKTQTSTSLASHWVNTISRSGSDLWLAGELSKRSKILGNINRKDRLGLLLGPNDQAGGAKRFQFFLSLGKKMVTSHYATTAANIKGFGYLTFLNGVGEIATGVLDMSSGLGRLAVGNTVKAKQHFDEGFTSIGSAANRGMTILDPQMSFNRAKAVLALSPEAEKALFRNLAGAGDAANPLERFNINPDTTSKIGGAAFKVLDATSSAMQAVTFIKIQDHMTKIISFEANLSREIGKLYKMNANKFFQQADSAVIVASKDFQENVVMPALEQTLQDVVSVSWQQRTKNTKTLMATAASWVEQASNKTILGVAIPFGSFANSVMYHTGNYTGVNYLRRKAHRVTQYSWFRGSNNMDPEKLINLNDPTDIELAGKALGFLAVMVAGIYGIPGTKTLTGEEPKGALWKVKNGYKWDQEPDSQGGIKNVKFEWPLSFQKITAQMAAHRILAKYEEDDLSFNGIKELYNYAKEVGTGKAAADTASSLFKGIPKHLWKDFYEQLGASNFRSLSKSTNSFSDMFNNLMYEGDFKEILNIPGVLVSQYTQFISRPLDPVNQFSKILWGENQNNDLRQTHTTLLGANKGYNDMFKYIDGLLPDEWLPKGVREAQVRESAVKETFYDAGKLIGVRSDPVPQIFEKLLNSAGMSEYLTIKRFDGPPEVGNYLIKELRRELNYTTKDLLENKFKGVNFSDLNLSIQQNSVRWVVKNARKKVMDQLNKAGPKEYLIANKLSAESKEDFRGGVKKYQKIYPGIIPETSARVSASQVIGMILSTNKDKPAIKVLEILDTLKTYVDDYKKLKGTIGDKDGISIEKLLKESRN